MIDEMVAAAPRSGRGGPAPWRRRWSRHPSTGRGPAGQRPQRRLRGHAERADRQAVRQRGQEPRHARPKTIGRFSRGGDRGPCRASHRSRGSRASTEQPHGPVVRRAGTSGRRDHERATGPSFSGCAGRPRPAGELVEVAHREPVRDGDAVTCRADRIVEHAGAVVVLATCVKQHDDEILEVLMTCPRGLAPRAIARGRLSGHG